MIGLVETFDKEEFLKFVKRHRYRLLCVTEKNKKKQVGLFAFNHLIFLIILSYFNIFLDLC